MSLQFFSFDKDDALKYGTEEAIILYHFRYWIKNNKSNNAHNRDGRHWCYNSYTSLHELFPFFNEAKCRRLIQSLKNQGAILVGNYNKSAYDKTCWYTLNDDTSIALKVPREEDGSDNSNNSEWQKKQIDLADLSDGSGKNDRPIPNTTNTSLTLPTPRSEGVSEVKVPFLKDEESLPEWNNILNRHYQWVFKNQLYKDLFDTFPLKTKTRLWRELKTYEEIDPAEAKDRFISALEKYRQSKLPQVSVEEIVIDL